MIDRRYESGESFVMYSKEELEAATTELSLQLTAI